MQQKSFVLVKGITLDLVNLIWTRCNLYSPA